MGNNNNSISDDEKQNLKHIENYLEYHDHRIERDGLSYEAFQMKYDIKDDFRGLHYTVKDGHVSGIFIDFNKCCEWCYDMMKEYMGMNTDYEECKNCGLEEIPEFFFDFKGLEIFILETREEVELPPSIKNRKNLKALVSDKSSEVNAFTRYWKENNLSKRDLIRFRNTALMLPKSEVDFLEELEKVYGKFYVKQIAVVKNNNITILSLRGTKDQKIETYMPSIENLENLSGLYLDDNLIKELPDSFGNLLNLKNLSLRNNPLVKLPDSIGKLRKLEAIDLSGSKLTELPNSFGDLESLKMLRLHPSNLPSNMMAKFGGKTSNWFNGGESANWFKYPQKVVKFYSLRKNGFTIDTFKFRDEEYFIIDNRLSLPNLNIKDIHELKGLYKIRNLKELDLSNNKIMEIKGLESLINLEELDLSNNKIMEINGLESLINLEELNLSKNNIYMIKGLDSLKKLKVLNLSFNKISLIRGLDSLTSLETIILSSNELKDIRGLENLKKPGLQIWL